MSHKMNLIENVYENVAMCSNENWEKLENWESDGSWYWVDHVNHNWIEPETNDTQRFQL